MKRSPRWRQARWSTGDWRASNSAPCGSWAIRPHLDQCAECGTKIDLTGRIAFGGIHGGALCRECRQGKSNVVSVSAGVLRTMAQLADLEAQAWRRMEIDARMLGELRGVLNHYIANLLGRKPRMYDYLHEFWR